MKDYKIMITVSEVGGIYSAKDVEAAKEIAQSECNDIYTRLRGRCRVEIESIEELKED